MRKTGLTVHIREVVGSSPLSPTLPLPVSAWYAFWAVREDIGSRKRRTSSTSVRTDGLSFREEKKRLRRYQHWLETLSDLHFPDRRQHG